MDPCGLIHSRHSLVHTCANTLSSSWFGVHDVLAGSSRHCGRYSFVPFPGRPAAIHVAWSAALSIALCLSCFYSLTSCVLFRLNQSRGRRCRIVGSMRSNGTRVRLVRRGCFFPFPLARIPHCCSSTGQHVLRPNVPVPALPSFFYSPRCLSLLSPTCLVPFPPLVPSLPLLVQPH